MNTLERPNKAKSLFMQKMNKIDKRLVRLIKGEKD